MNYIIGLIEDDAVEASEIMLTLIENSNGDLDGSSFKQYELKRESDFKEKLLDTIENDILNNLMFRKQEKKMIKQIQIKYTQKRISLIRIVLLQKRWFIILSEILNVIQILEQL